MNPVNLKDVLVHSADWLNMAIITALWLGGIVVTITCVVREFGTRKVRHSC